MKLFGLNWGSDCVYTVKDKSTIYSTQKEKDRKFFKAPQEGVGEVRSVAFQELGGGQRNPDGTLAGVFLTAMSVSCPIYKKLGIKDSEIKEKVKFIQDFIKKPYEQLYGRVGMLDANNYEFWRQYSSNIYKGRVFSLENIQDRLDLFMACLNGDIAVPSNMNNPELFETPYMIEDYYSQVDDKERLMVEKYEAMQFLDDIINSDFDYYLSILKYVKKYAADVTPDKEFLKRTVLKIFEGLDNTLTPEKFVGIINDAKTKEGKERIEWEANVQDLITFNILTKRDNFYMYQGSRIGATVDDIIYKISGKDVSFEPYVRDEILQVLQAEKNKRKDKRVQ